MSETAATAATALITQGLETLEAMAREAGLVPACDEFFFLRHGETAGNASRTFQPLDEPLNAQGHQQARAAAAILGGASFSRIIASDLPRAWLTAGKVAAASGHPVQPEALIRERFFGDWIGAPSAGFDWRHDPPGGETLATFVARTLLGLQKNLAQGDRPLLVAHGGNLHVLRGALGVPWDAAHTGNALPLHFRRTRQGWSMVALSR